MATEQQILDLQQKLRDRMTPSHLREAEDAMVDDVESKSGNRLNPDERRMVTVMACCWIAGLVPISIQPGEKTNRLAGQFRTFWQRNGRSPSLGEARAIVGMVDATLLEPSTSSQLLPHEARGDGGSFLTH